MSTQPPKAYKDLDFLNSSDARLIRILAEYLHPKARFRKLNVKDTIVFFGSARLVDRKTAEREIRALEAIIAQNPTPEAQQRKKIAEKKLALSQYYEDARELSRLLTEWSMNLNNTHRRFLITSGGGPGIMEAANRGASEVPGGRSIGMNISLPHEQGSNPYINSELNFEFHYFFTRKFWFIYLAKALVVFPGGFGTLDELWEVLTLLQTQKVQKKMPVVLFGEDYWKRLINFEILVEELMVDAEDLRLLHFSNSPEEAFTFLINNLIL